MSQEELGRRVGVQRAAVNKHDTDGVTNIPISTVEKIAYVNKYCNIFFYIGLRCSLIVRIS